MFYIDFLNGYFVARETRDATNLETDVDLASNLWDLDLDLDLYAMFGFGFGFVVQIWDMGLDLFSDLYKSNKQVWIC